jgi:hypothetical protein
LTLAGMRGGALALDPPFRSCCCSPKVTARCLTLPLRPARRALPGVCSRGTRSWRPLLNCRGWHGSPVRGASGLVVLGPRAMRVGEELGALRARRAGRPKSRVDTCGVDRRGGALRPPPHHRLLMRTQLVHQLLVQRNDEPRSGARESSDVDVTNSNKFGRRFWIEEWNPPAQPSSSSSSSRVNRA